MPLVLAVALVFVLSLGGALSAAAPAAQATPAPQNAATHTAETDEQPAGTVMISGQPVLWILAGAGPYTAQLRAERISERLRDIIRDRTLRDTAVTVTEADGSSELRAGSRLIMVVTPQDAAAIGAGRATLAQQYARILEEAIGIERRRYTPAALLRSAIYALVATALFAAALWGIVRITSALRHLRARRLALRSETLRAMQAEILSDQRISRTLAGSIAALRVVLILVALNLYLTYVLGLFPWTRAISLRLLDYFLTPLRALGAAIVGYLPNLLFLLVIGAAVNLAIRLVAAFFRHIEHGRLVFQGFPAEWADPTYKIVRVLLIAFGVVVAFPYMPASSSPAFAGVSVFVGVLVSLASSSALSNTMAGIVLTYTGAFRLGDRVKLGDAFGDIIETSLLATRIRTIKNEEITIPNSIALGSTVTNYTREAATRGLILHTTVTIGYDAPWRRIHDLLIEAAHATPGILRQPPPFVWQTSLNDFYVSYEINAYTASPAEMIDIYAALHASIQDAFFAAGVEIMSPHFTSIRDGNTVAIPEAFRGPGYHAPAFRVEDVAGVRAASTAAGSARTE